MRKNKVRPVALALAGALLVGLLSPCVALAADSSTITIQGADDFVRFTQNCAFDMWSQGKTILLKNDIDLSQTEWSPIPTFGGTFDGGGHAITGLSLSGGASYQGLFRFVQESGVIKNLHVEGSISAIEEQEYLGGIAGCNEGTIMDCSFFGTVSGKSAVGGIVGINEADGSIYHCMTEGAVIGERQTGGIAGKNNGIITGCTNRSLVNTEHPDETRDLEDGLSGLTRDMVSEATMDTGGIVGTSSGILQNCQNEGTIGYPHVGYNVGGIAGRSSGYLDSCSNCGEIQGRKDVGGIVGQLAPNVRMVFSPDSIDELQNELDRLGDLVDSTLDRTKENKNTISDRLDHISDFTHIASDSVSDLTDIMGDWADGTIDSVNDLADTVADTIDHLEIITSSGEDILDVMADGIDRLEDSIYEIADAASIGEDGLDSLSDAVEFLKDSLKEAQEGLDKIREALKDIPDAFVIDDPNRFIAQELLEAGTQQLTRALTQCGDAVARIAAILMTGNIGEAERELIQQSFGLLKGGFHSAAAATGRIFGGVAAMVGGVDWKQVKDSVKQVLAAIDDAFGISDNLYRSMEALQNAFSHFADMSGELKDGLGELADSMDIFEDGARDLGDVFDDIHDLFEDLSNREPIQIDKLGDNFHQSEDNLHDAVTSIGDHLDLLRDEISGSGDTLSSDIRNIGDQFQVIADLITDAIDDAQEKELDDLWDDVSQELIDSTTLGKAKSCVNYSFVNGDLNVGGIAGAMAIEHDSDPEDEIAEVGEKSLNFRYETRAILQSCVNHGFVTSKKDAAGGVVGRMDLGYLWKCENYGMIETTDGDYTGGIAGISRSVIRRCWSKCILSGCCYVGGIAGYGYEVYQCSSLIAVKSADGHTGSIVGDWDREDGILKENRFVEGHLAGADGISYAGQAEPVPYEDLTEGLDVPISFLHMTVTYMIGGKALETVPYTYGDPLSQKADPNIPQKDGYYGIWEEPGETQITVDHILEGIYIPYITTLSSDIMRDEIRSVFLVEGMFDENAKVSTQLLESGDTFERWEVILSNTYDSNLHIVRYAPPENWKKISVNIMSAAIENSTQVEVKADGTYFVFPVEGTNLIVEVETHISNLPVLIGALIAGFMLLFITATILYRKKRKRKALQQERRLNCADCHRKA